MLPPEWRMMRRRPPPSCRGRLPPGPFAHFEVVHAFAVDLEPYGRADLVEAVFARRAGVDVQQVIHRVVDHLQDVGVARDEGAAAGGSGCAARPAGRSGAGSRRCGSSARAPARTRSRRRGDRPCVSWRRRYSRSGAQRQKAAMRSATSSEPMSPACQISSTSRRKLRSTSSKVPCVSEMIPILFNAALIRLSVGR